MKTITLVLALLSITALVSYADVPTADAVMASAKATAAGEKKAIFLHFGASWCSWCKRLDAFLDRPDIKPVFEKYFVPIKLVVQEHDQKKALENPGADTLLQKLGGPAGLPYFAFLDSKGQTVATSMLNGNNIGYPAEPGEIDYFVQMMKKTAPNISEGDLKTIETALRCFKRS